MGSGKVGQIRKKCFDYVCSFSTDNNNHLDYVAGIIKYIGLLISTLPHN